MTHQKQKVCDVCQNAAAGNYYGLQVSHPVYQRRKRVQRQVLRCVLLIVVLGGAGGGLTRDQIVIRYTPMPGVHRVPGADGIGVTVQEVDVPSNKQEVSKKRWEDRPEYDFGGEIIAQNNLTGVIATAIASELSNRGFQQQEGPVIVVAELSRFYNEFKGFPEKAVAEVILNVQVKKPDGQIVFARTVTGQGIQSLTVVAWNVGGASRSGANAKAALEGALSDAVSKLFDHTGFINAVLLAGAAK